MTRVRPTRLQTGQWHNYSVAVSDANATNYPLRITLVWTDPPGNPAAGLALVNDLDLVVTDGTGTNVYVGNNFQPGDIYTEVSVNQQPGAPATRSTTWRMFILNASFGLAPPYTVSVRGTRVNVNAVTTQTNIIGQDYALVISSDDQTLAAPLTVTDLGTNQQRPGRWSRRPTTGWRCCISGWEPTSRILNEYPGSLYPAPGNTNGNLVQWHFFTFTNVNYLSTRTPPFSRTAAVPTLASSYTNAIFATFLPPTLTIPISSPVNQSYPAAQQRGPGFVCFDQSGAVQPGRRRRWPAPANRWGRAAARRSCSPISPRFRSSTLESSRRPSRGGTLRFSRRWRPTSTMLDRRPARSPFRPTGCRW